MDDDLVKATESQRDKETEANSEDNVVEGQIVDDTAPSVAVDPDQAGLILNLENTIKGHLGQIEKLRAELSKNRDMLKAAFENDPVFNEHAEAAKAANKVKAATKAEILKKPDGLIFYDEIPVVFKDIERVERSIDTGGIQKCCDNRKGKDDKQVFDGATRCKAIAATGVCDDFV